MYQVLWRERAVKHLKKIPAIEQKKVLRIVRVLAENPYVGKKLEGELSDFYRVRAWPYRVLYQILDNDVVISSVVHRQGAYK